ncbi:MAG: Lrp/AsnC family transcriptional regulator [Methylococcaceae bacterium]
MAIDEIDRQIIAVTQTGLPLTPKPYQTIADSIGISDEVVMQKIVVMQEQGIIRRIAAVPNHYRLGYKFNGMTVWNIEDKHIDEMGERIGQLNFVSHCYHRPRHLPEWPYNLFAMIHSKTEEGVKRQQQIIADLLGQYNLGQDVLYSTRILKKTGLRIS